MKVAIDAWTFPSGVATGRVFRPVNRRRGSITERMGEKVVWQMLKRFGQMVADEAARAGDQDPFSVHKSLGPWRVCSAIPGAHDWSSQKTNERFVTTLRSVLLLEPALCRLLASLPPLTAAVGSALSMCISSSGGITCQASSPLAPAFGRDNGH